MVFHGPVQGPTSIGNCGEPSTGLSVDVRQWDTILSGSHMPQKLLTVTIKDCRVDTFRSGGKGGQNQNTRDTGVRVVHEASGAIGESREHRSQLQNKTTAFVRMAHTPTFQRWNKIQAAKVMGVETVEDRVNRAMLPHNLLIETYGEQGWSTCDM